MQLGKQITHVNGYPLTEKWYDSFAILDPEAERAGLLEAWSTPEQILYNARTVLCDSCRGWGYKRDENVGCQACGGLGRVEQ